MTATRERWPAGTPYGGQFKPADTSPAPLDLDPDLSYRWFLPADGTPLDELELDPAETWSPWSERAHIALLEDPTRPVRIYRALPAKVGQFNPGGEYATFDPGYAFGHALSVSLTWRRRMHVICADVPARELRGHVSGGVGYWGPPRQGEAVPALPSLGVEASAYDVQAGDWFGVQDACGARVPYWSRCVERTEEGLVTVSVNNGYRFVTRYDETVLHLPSAAGRLRARGAA